MTLAGVQRFRVPAQVMRATEEAIRSAGKDGYELFVIWSGVRDGDAFAVLDTHVPRQVSFRLEAGLCVLIDGTELHRLNVWLYESKQVVGAQVHSHPADAYHSETDDTYPTATLDGSLSIVLPDFGRDGFASTGIAAYRLGRTGWMELTYPLGELIEVIDGNS